MSCLRPQAPWSRRRRLQAASQSQLQTASWVPRRHGPAPPLPRLPAGPSLCQPRAYKLTHTYLRRHARTHSDCLAHTRKGRTHWSHACRGWGWRRPRKEGTDGRCTHRRPELGEEEERPGNLRLRREGAHRRESKRDAEETPEDNGWAVKGRRGLTGCSRGGNSSNPCHGERGVY